MTEFGHTWWGKKWLSALEEIDYSKRLPKGKKYALENHVVSVKIDKNIITAKVQGRKMLPYTVTLDFPEFTEQEKNRILKIVKANSFYLSQLESKNLPVELFEELNENDIYLFPQMMDDIVMDCSCSSWDVPCKHIAAVIYILANEIDKHPFYIFNIHNFDFFNHIKPKQTEESSDYSLPSIRTFLANKKQISANLKDVAVKYEHLDFAKIPDLSSTINKLLTSKPLFYPAGDFKSLLVDRNKKIQKLVRQFIKNTELVEHADILFDSCTISFKNSSLDFDGELRGTGDPLVFQAEEMETFIDYMQTHPLSRLNEYSDTMGFMAQIFSFSLALMEKSAFIPDIFEIGEDEFMIRWIPAIFDKTIRQMCEILAANLPADIFFYYQKPFKPLEQVYFLTNLIITSVQKRIDLPLRNIDYRILSLFFEFEPFTQVKFEDQIIPQTIHLWLSRFFISMKSVLPVIKIDESEKSAASLEFQVLVQDVTKKGTEPKPLFKFLKSRHSEKNMLLKDLSLLSTYLPQVNEFLKTAGGENTLTIPGKDFVGVWFDAMPLLQSLGVKTILPRALKQVFMPKISLDFDVDESGNEERISYFDFDNILNFNWNIAIGDQFLTPDEFREIADKYTGIVKLKNSYVYLDPKEVRKLLKQMENPPKMERAELLRMNLNQQYRNTPVRQSDRATRLFERIFTKIEPDLPENLNAKLRPYQVRGYQWLYSNFKIGFGSLIADDMGLGKTIQIITLLLKLKEEGILGKRKALIIVPATLLTNWQKEIEKFAPMLKPLVYHGFSRKLELKDIDIVITTYSLVRGDNKKLNSLKWLVVIADEAQNIKNPGSNQTKSVKSIKADVRIAMTGTPVENRLMDYWSILDLIMKKLVGSRGMFNEVFATPIERFRDESRMEEFRRITAPFIIRRIKTDKSIIDDLPEKICVDEYSKLTREQTALYQKVIDETELNIDGKSGIERKGYIFKLMTSLKQICNHPSLYLKETDHESISSGKSELLMGLLDKIYSIDEKVLIFTQYKQMGDLLVPMLAKRFGGQPLFLHGGLSRHKRDAMIHTFQTDKQQRIMILSLKAGGTGLNLTAANNVIHYDLWWNPAVENQATDRAFRIGQHKNVTVYRMITKGSFEEKINDMLKSKSDLANLTVNVGEKWISELTDSELRDLVALDRD